ncbi:MAG TPA: Rieske 2Fe-2S domain-containing protein, partial [Chloroflexota bacterium]|nr:Rieske 2Fe-2S domain-containing protein [Chloroflexota bacterium]
RDGEIIACPWHGWEFDLRTGQSWCAPERLRVRTYEVQLRPGSAVAGDVDGAAPAPVEPASREGAHADAPAPGRVRGPYRAQTYPVTTEGQYVVVDLGRPAASPTSQERSPQQRTSR